MQRVMLGGKIHRATVTQADLHYVGSVTLDKILMDASGILPNEQVYVLNVTNGVRLVTYAIEGAAGSGIVGINGAAAHMVSPGDLVIVLNYVTLDDTELVAYTPRVVHVDENNRIVALGNDPAEPVAGMMNQLCGRSVAGLAG